MPHLLKYFIILILLWTLGLAWFITLIPHEPAQDKENTDAIVALTGGGLRLERGFQLLAEGRAKRMFISGVENGVTLDSLLRKKEFHAFADHLPANSVTLGYKARSTVGNAIETAQWIEQEHVASIRLVTGSYHIPRSVYELHEASPETKIIPEPVFPGHFEHDAWWRSFDSIRLVLSEYHKYLATLIGHHLIPKS